MPIRYTTHADNIVMKAKVNVEVSIDVKRFLTFFYFKIKKRVLTFFFIFPTFFINKKGQESCAIAERTERCIFGITEKRTRDYISL